MANWTQKIRAHGETVKRNSAPRQPRLPPQTAWAQVRQPFDTDPGEVLPVFYTVNEGVLTVTDEKGAPSKEIKPHTLMPHDDAKSLAIHFALERQRLNDPNNFNRRLDHRPLGIA
jgi:hypothetical protein